MEDPPNLVESIDEPVDVAGVVVECDTRAAGAVPSQIREQWLRAMVAGANAHVVHVQDGGNVVRVHVLDVEGDRADVSLSLLGTDDGDLRQLAQAFAQVDGQQALAFLNGVQTPTVETASADFNQLGIQMRCYYDYGASAGDCKAALYSTGA